MAIMASKVAIVSVFGNRNTNAPSGEGIDLTFLPQMRAEMVRWNIFLGILGNFLRYRNSHMHMIGFYIEFWDF
jgi:hypothetical protein